MFLVVLWLRSSILNQFRDECLALHGTMFKCNVSEVWSLTLGMLGSAAHPVLSAKAKESHGLLAFALAVLEDNAEQFRGLGGDNTLRLVCSLLDKRCGVRTLIKSQIIQTTCDVFNVRTHVFVNAWELSDH